MGVGGVFAGSARPQSRPLGGKALCLAWGIEALAVSMGLLLAVYAGLEGGTSDAFGMAIAVMPFAALSVIELTKIPLVALAFAVRGHVWRLVAVAALAVVTLATFENFVFGFERGFTERLKRVEEADFEARAAAQARERAQARHADLLAQQELAAARLGALRDEAAAVREQAQ